MGIVLQAFLGFLFPGQLVLETVIAFILVITISYGFELFSKLTGKGHYEVKDAVASTIGGVLGMIIILMVELGVVTKLSLQNFVYYIIPFTMKLISFHVDIS